MGGIASSSLAYIILPKNSFTCLDEVPKMNSTRKAALGYTMIVLRGINVLWLSVSQACLCHKD